MCHSNGCFYAFGAAAVDPVRDSLVGVGQQFAGAFEAGGVAADLGAQVVLRKPRFDLRFRQQPFHVPLPHRVPAAGLSGRGVDVAFPAPGAEQPRRYVDGAGRKGVVDRRAEFPPPFEDDPLLRLADRDVNAVVLQVGGLQPQQVDAAQGCQQFDADVKLHYTERHRLPESTEKELGLIYHDNVESMLKACDVITINTPLHPETEHLFNDTLIAKMKRGAYLINTARGKICDENAVARALESGHLAGYAGDVWFPQPPAKDHPWRTMPNHGMTPHVSGTSLPAQARYAAGVREILECWFAKRPIRQEYLIVENGKLAGTGIHSYSAGNATQGSEEAVRYKRA